MKIKKQSAHKSVKIKKLENYKNCLKATKLENKNLKQTIQKKNKIDADSFEKDRKEFIKNNKLMLKTQQNLNVKDIMFLLKKCISNRKVFNMQKEKTR